jgi:cholest-4-en-3-one 26-monooxygenase
VHEDVIYYPSRNFDETVIKDPYAFDITRDPNPHISFGGGGPHFCLGAHLARLKVGIMFEQLALRLPNIKLKGTPRGMKSNFIHGIKEMSVTYK